MLPSIHPSIHPCMHACMHASIHTCTHHHASCMHAYIQYIHFLSTHAAIVCAGKQQSGRLSTPTTFGKHSAYCTRTRKDDFEGLREEFRVLHLHSKWRIWRPQNSRSLWETFRTGNFAFQGRGSGKLLSPRYWQFLEQYQQAFPKYQVLPDSAAIPRCFPPSTGAR